MNSENWLSSAEAAARLSKTDRTIRRLCESGKLAHRKEGKAYLIDPVSLEQYISAASRRSSSVEKPVSDSPTTERTSLVAPKPVVQLAEAIQELPVDTERTSDKGEDKDSGVSDTPTDNSSEEIETEQSVADTEEEKFKQALAGARKALKERLDAEKHCIAQVQSVLAQLDGRYRAERERNKKVQESLKRLLAELQAPLVDSKPPLWRRLFGRA